MNNSNKRNILVTGGAGFIGSHLVNKLVSQKNKVIVVDNLSTGKKENINPKAEFYNLDISDYEKIKTVFKGADYVFHLAANPSVFLSVKDPVGTSKVNVMGTINVFKAAVDAKAKRVVFASSSAVYGNQKTLPFKETMTPNPVSPYGLQKLSGEQFAKIFSELYKIEIVCLRYFNVFGPGIGFNSDYSLVIGKFLSLRLQQKPLTIFGDGKQTRDFCYVQDIVEANIKAMESKKIKGGEVINIGHGKSCSINYLAELIGGKVQRLPKRQGDALHTMADISLAKRLLGWRPKTDFKSGLDATKNWFAKTA